MPETLRLEDLAASNQHLIDDPVAHRLVVAQANDLARTLDVVHIPALLAPTAVSLRQFQTGFRDQQSRGTCYAFAACAAIVNKAGELYSDYVTSAVAHENNSSFWGFQGSSDIVDKLARAAIPDETAAPYVDQPALDQLRQSIPAGNLDSPGTSSSSSSSTTTRPAGRSWEAATSSTSPRQTRPHSGTRSGSVVGTWTTTAGRASLSSAEPRTTGPPKAPPPSWATTTATANASTSTGSPCRTGRASTSGSPTRPSGSRQANRKAKSSGPTCSPGTRTPPPAGPPGAASPWAPASAATRCPATTPAASPPPTGSGPGRSTGTAGRLRGRPAQVAADALPDHEAWRRA